MIYPKMIKFLKILNDLSKSDKIKLIILINKMEIWKNVFTNSTYCCDCNIEGNILGMDKFVLNIPEWQGELVFSKEILILAGVVLLIVVGVLFCFWGYKYFGTILFMGIGAIVCYGSFLLVEPMTGNSVIRMFLTVSLTFLGLCFVYFLSIILGFILDKLRIRTALASMLPDINSVCLAIQISRLD